MLNIFNIKLKNSSYDKPNNKGNETGQTRHYPPANKEWFNSIYAFNKNTTKLLPVADKVILKLIKSYFNLYNRILEKKIKFRRLRMRVRRLSTNRIFVSKAELKHTNDKVVITLYVYNRQEKYYLNKIKKLTLRNSLYENLGRFYSNILESIFLNDTKMFTRLYEFMVANIKFSGRDKRSVLVIQSSRIISKVIKHINILFKTLNRNSKDLDDYFDNSKDLDDYYNILDYYYNSNNTVSQLNFESDIGRQTDTGRKLVLAKVRKKEIEIQTGIYSHLFESYEDQYLKNFFIKTLEKEMLTIYLTQIISFNKFKFEKFYILPLTSLINKVYNKKVEFNLVNLKYFHLNSHIFTETIVTKLKDRNNRLLSVLDASLLKFELPFINRLEMYNDIYNKKKKMQNLRVNDLLSYPVIFKPKIQSEDTIDKMLLKLYPENFVWKKLTKNLQGLRPAVKSNAFKDSHNEQAEFKHVTNTIFSYIKHKSISGIRLEAAGRLSRRNTAARSVFKLRYKGNIKNMDSSYKGLSSVVLRGHVKSNLQYTFLKSKIRIGSFGIKGWVSSN